MKISTSLLLALEAVRHDIRAGQIHRAELTLDLVLGKLQPKKRARPLEIVSRPTAELKHA